MKLAIHFGAGNIGRGFIAPVLQENNYEVIFVDVNKQLIEQINTLKEYKVSSISLNSSTNFLVENISGLLLEDKDVLYEKIAQADLITTSVGPKFVKDIFDLVSYIETNKIQSFIAFENMYRASTTNSTDNSLSKLVLIDAVVDKIVPPQNTTSLDVTVEEYGSIVLDSNKGVKPLNESKIVSYKNYEHEFYKKLWLLNGLHLKLAYYGLSKGNFYIDEIISSPEGREFAEQAVKSLSEAYYLFSKTDENLDDFGRTILDRFALPDIKDQVARIARNPEIKFSKNERFEYPLRLLINNNKDVNTFRIVLDIIIHEDFPQVEGFSSFNKKVLKKGKTNIYSEFWEIENYSDNYIERLGL